MKRAVIFYNGDLTDVSQGKKYLKRSDYIICADGGTKHALQLNIIPRVIIGDLDSTPRSLQKKLAKYPIEWIRYKSEKDETDSELALQCALEKGFTQILVFGLLGSRLDHLLTNIFSLAYMEKKGAMVTIVEGNQEIRVIRDNVRIEGKIGDLVSLLPFRGNAKYIKTNGLQFKLADEDLRFGYSRGLSNVLTHPVAEISLKQGLLLVIHTKS